MKTTPTGRAKPDMGGIAKQMPTERDEPSLTLTERDERTTLEVLDPQLA